MSKLLRLGVSAVLVGYISLNTDWNAVGRSFAGLNPWPWVAGIFLLIGAQIVSAWRWQFFAREMRFDRPLWQLAGFYYIGMYFSLMLPTTVGGDVVRAWYLDGGSGRKLSAFGACFLDRLNGLLVLISIACLATLLCPLPLPDWIPWTVAGVALGAFGGVALLPLLARWNGPGGDAFKRVHATVSLLRSPRILPMTTLLSVVVQLANICILWLIGVALDAPVPFAFYFVLMPLVSLFTLLPAVNGIGLRETGMVVLLATQGVDRGTALAMSILWFFNGVTVSLMGGLVYLFGTFPKPETPARPDEDQHGPLDRHSDQGRTRQLDQAA